MVDQAYHLLEVKIHGQWLHLDNLFCTRECNITQANAVNATFRCLGLMYPMRLREVDSEDELFRQANFKAHDYADVRLALNFHWRDNLKENIGADDDVQGGSSPAEASVVIPIWPYPCAASGMAPVDVTPAENVTRT
jgi:hypothetical protein